MPRINRLKPLAVEKAKIPGRHARWWRPLPVVKPGPRKSWAFIYRRGAKTTELGLGSLSDVSLVAARAEATDLRGVLAAKAAIPRPTGSEARRPRPSKMRARSLSRVRPGGTTSATTRSGTADNTPGVGCECWRSTLSQSRQAVVRRRRSGGSPEGHRAHLVRPSRAWRSWCVPTSSPFSTLPMLRASAPADNPARWDLLKHSLPARKGAPTAGHFKALSYIDMPALLKDLAEQDAVSALCMRFTILTVARTKESTACSWSEIDLASRMRVVQIFKGGRVWQHHVPLSDQAIELLRSLMIDGKPAGEYLFPSRGGRQAFGQQRHAGPPVADGVERPNHHPWHSRRLQDVGDRAYQLRP